MIRCNSLWMACFVLWFAGQAWAAEPAGVQAAVAGSTVKTLARAFIASADMDQVKANTIEKLKRMGPENYRRQYARRYKVIHDLPVKIKKKYGLVEDLPKDRLVAVISSLDKKRIYELIEAVPNETIAREIGAYFQADDPAVKDKGLMQRAQMAWAEIMADMARKPPAINKSKGKSARPGE